MWDSCERRCIQALKDAQARYDADPSCGAPPIMWDETEQKYYGVH